MVKGKTSKIGTKRQAVTDFDTASTFLGRLAREIVRLTSPGATHYSVQSCCWLDASGTEAFGISQMEKLCQTVGVQGLSALDTLIATRIVKLIKKLHDLCIELCSIQTSGQKSMATYAKELQSCAGLSVPVGGAMWYVDAVYSVGSRIWSPILEIIAAIGQSQLLRKLIALQCRNVSLLEAPVAFHRTMQVLSEFVEDKGADFSSCSSPQDRVSHQEASTGGQDCCSIASGSTFVVYGNKSDEETSPYESRQMHRRQKSEGRRPVSGSPKIHRELAAESSTGASPSAEPFTSPDGELPDSVFARENRTAVSEMHSQLGTITESISRSERDPSYGTQSSHVQSRAFESPDLSAHLSDFVGSHVTKSSEQLFEASTGLAKGMPRLQKKQALILQNSEASSSGMSDPVWDPSLLRRRAKRASSEASGLPVPSELSSRNMFLSSLDLSLLGGEGSVDLFNSLSSNAGAPVLHGAGPEGVFRMLQSTGFLNAMETRYISEQPPIPEVPIILFLATVSIVHKYEFNKQSASLMRPLGSTIPDAKSFVHGLVTILYQYLPSMSDQFLRHVGQYVRAYLKTATGATAQGIAAAGVKMVLPQEVQRTVAFICEMCEVGGWKRKRAESFIPPFLLDVWMLGV